MQKMTEETLRILQSVLYKITPERSGGLMQQVKIPEHKHRKNRLQGAIELILDQTASEPMPIVLAAYSNMFCVCRKGSVSACRGRWRPGNPRLTAGHWAL